MSAFNHSDSEGETINLFGTDYTVSSKTDGTSLYLLKSSEKITLTSDDPSATVTVEGNTYTIELDSASDTAATVKVTNSAGTSDTKEVNEGDSRTINGLEVGVDTASENNFKLSATLLVGSNRVKLADGSALKLGSDETTVDGTNVRFGESGSERPNNITKLTVQISADDSDVDALTEGSSFTDPIFGSLKLDFSGLNIPEDSSSREEIKVSGSSSDKMSVNFMPRGVSDAKSIDWYYNKTTALKADGKSIVGVAALADSGGDVINTFERQQVNVSEYVILGNEDYGGILELRSMSNTTDSTDDTIEFKDVFDDTTYKVSVTSEGAGTLTYKGKSYTVNYVDYSSNTEGLEYVRIRHQDGSRTTANNGVIFPTIETSKGARLFFYEPTVIDFMDWDRVNETTYFGGNLSTLKFPDGDGYTSIAVTSSQGAAAAGQPINDTWLVGGHFLNLSSYEAHTGNFAGVKDSVYVTVGQLTYNISYTGATAISGLANDGGRNSTAIVQLMNVANATLTTPAIVIFEEQDDSASQLYEAIIVNVEGAGTTSTSLGVSDVEFTWGRDAQFDEIQMKSDTNIYKSADYWGTVSTMDQSDTDSYSATISYPNEQVYAQVYAADADASITGGSTSGGTATPLGSIIIADSEGRSASGKNLIVVGGSCVNSVAASLLGGALCGADFTAKTGVGSGSFLIETYSRTGDKVATLVAGYNAGDTTKAATALTTQTIDTMVGKKYTGSTSTSVTLVTDTA